MPLSRVYGVATFYNQFRLIRLVKMLLEFAGELLVTLKILQIYFLHLETALKAKAGRNNTR